MSAPYPQSVDDRELDHRMAMAMAMAMAIAMARRRAPGTCALVDRNAIRPNSSGLP